MLRTCGVALPLRRHTSGSTVPVTQPGSLAIYGPASRRCLVTVSASKGFGSTEPKSAKDDSGRKNRSRAKNIKRTLPTTVTPENLSPGKEEQFKAVQAIDTRIAQEAEDEEFSARLHALKAQGAEKKQSMGTAAAAAPAAAGAPAPQAAFDAKPEDIYANPPSIAQTLVSQLNSDVSDPKLRDAQFGPSQLGVAIGAVIFGLVFVLVAGGDFVPNKRFKGVRPAREAPDAVEEGIIKGRIAVIEQQLAANPNDAEATQALALSYAQLFQFDKAASLLDKLTQRDPNNADAWRLLGETALLGEQSGRAVKAYERAAELRDNDLQIATGAVDAYIANAQYAKAVEFLQGLRLKAPSISATGTIAVGAAESAAAEAAASAPTPALPVLPAPNVSASSADAPTAAADTDSAQPSTSGSSSSGSSEAKKGPRMRARNEPIRPLDPVSVELLLAKTYSAWRGHDSDALATYDALVARFPEDWRGYLAKGVWLRDKGRRADAERMFLQARFYAPESRQRFVQSTADTKPVVDLPDND